MKLTDREILELNALCGAVVDGTLSAAQRARLTEWLRQSEAVRRYYVRALGQSASLYEYAGEVHADAPDLPAASRRVAPMPYAGFVALAAAAVIALGLWAATYRWRTTVPAGRPEPSVARITGAAAAEWADGRRLAPGAAVALGSRLQLKSGVAEVTFASGARVVLRGATSLDVTSAWDATLRSGTLTVLVPPEAIGFRIVNRAVEIVDLGTEFTMTADAGGSAEVLVLKGEVEAAPHTDSDPDTILLREQQSRRFALTGVSPVPDSDRKFAEARREIPLQRFAPTIQVRHWSFNEGRGTEAGGDGGTEPALALRNVADPQRCWIAGHLGGALQFDGQLQVSGRVPGLSGGKPHTIAFWVKVPNEAALSDAYAMVAWTTQLRQLGSRPVQISWNRRPAEGPLGALRTDFGGGCAIGRTSLRDGRWHHVAVLFSPGDGAATPVQVKQYVDGRLESSTIIPGRVRAPTSSGDAASNDVLWLGCRLTGHQRHDQFRGDLDELFVADGLLEPEDIVSLMHQNRLGSPPVRMMADVATGSSRMELQEH